MCLWPLIAASSLNWPPDEIQTTSAFLSDASSIFDIASLVFPETLFTVTNERLLVPKRYNLSSNDCRRYPSYYLL